MSKLKSIIHVLIFTIFILLAWQVVQNSINKNRLQENRTGIEAFIPSPLTIVETFKEEWMIIFFNAGFTIFRASIGFIVGITFAVAVSIIFLLWPGLRRMGFPIMFAVNSFPIVGLAPAIILAFGQGSLISMVFISALICYFPTLVTLDTAFKNINKEILDLMKVFNASSLQIIRMVKIPLAIPYFFASLKLAVPGSIIGVTMGEWLGTRKGLGQLITIALYQLRPGMLYASLFTLVGICLIFITLINLLEYKFIKWKNVY